MNKIRKGNDIHIRWAISINDGDTSLDDIDITIEVRDAMGRVSVLPHTISESRYVDADFLGVNHNTIGRHTLTAWVNKGKVGQAVLDRTDAFVLVKTSEEANGSFVDGNVEVKTIELFDAMTIGIQGKSAYQSWLDTGHEGTEEEFVEWIRSGNGGSSGQSDIGLSVVGGLICVTFQE